MEIILIGLVLFFLSFAYFLAAGGFLLGFFGALWSSSSRSGAYLDSASRHSTVYFVFVVWTLTFLELVEVPYEDSVKLHALAWFLVGTLLGRLYAPSYFDGSERTGKREWLWWKRLRIWRPILAYFSFSFDFADEAAVSEEGPAVIGVHPHGLWNVSGPLCVLNSDVEVHFFAGLHWWLFWIPFFRDVCLWAGSVDVSKDVVKSLLDEGKKVGLCPGGAREMMLVNVNELTLHFGHDGFLRVAWEKGVPAVPIFSEGENRVWLSWNALPRLRNWTMNKIGYPLPVFFFPIPFPEKVTLHIGRPVRPEDVDDYETFKKGYYAELFRLIHENETVFPLSLKLKSEIENALS